MNKLSIIVPKDWSELEDQQLYYVFNLLAANMSSEQIKTYCLFRFGKIKMLCKYGDGFLVKHDKEEYLVITKETITQWYDGSKTWEGTFKYENDKIYVNGTSKYTVVSISGKEMVLSYPGLLLVDEYREHYKKR